MSKEKSNHITVSSDEGRDDDFPTEGMGRDEMIKLLSMTYDEAMAVQEEWTSAGCHSGRGERGPFFRWLGVQELKELHKRYKAEKNPAAITEALYICAYDSLSIPSWCESAYITAYRKVRHYKAKSWDDVFGCPHPKGTHLAAKRQKLEKQWLVYIEIEKIKKENPSIRIDGDLFESVGLKLGIGGKTLTEEYYYEIKKLHPISVSSSATTTVKMF